jgi:hypothetical protein
VARPKYFFAAPLAASALWAIFLPMLIADLGFRWSQTATAGRQYRPGYRCLPEVRRHPRAPLWVSVNGRAGPALVSTPDERDNYGDEADEADNESNDDDHVDASDLVLELQYTPHLRSTRPIYAVVNGVNQQC